MAVAQVVDVTQKLELVVHGGNDGVEAVSNQSNLFVELGITGQSINSNSGELGEVLQDARSLLEEPIIQVIIYASKTIKFLMFLSSRL